MSNIIYLVYPHNFDGGTFLPPYHISHAYFVISKKWKGKKLLPHLYFQGLTILSSVPILTQMKRQSDQRQNNIFYT